jgi:DNA-binding CsgD family transcriptional regulator
MPRGKVPRLLKDRFWEKVRGAAACWTWIGSCDRKGYGQLKVSSVYRKAHRISWELHYGPIPGGLCVLHHCDNPPCVRPDHLFLGTNHDNVIDSMIKGRRAQGEHNGNGKLTTKQVEEIRLYIAQGVTHRAIAKHLNIASSTVSNIRRGKTRKHK